MELRSQNIFKQIFGGGKNAKFIIQYYAKIYCQMFCKDTGSIEWKSLEKIETKQTKF